MNARATTLERINAVMAETFDRDGLRVTRGTTASDVEQWDSLSHIRLILAIEMEFGLTFSSLEASGLANVGELVDMIDRKSG